MSSEPAPPDPESDPTDHLPDPGEGWEQTETNEQAAGMVGAEAGMQARYDGPDGESYTVEILRWENEEDAESGIDTVYSDWDVQLTHGVFSFAGNGPDVEQAGGLLASSPALNEAAVSS